jgi:hypothetical protein
MLEARKMTQVIKAQSYQGQKTDSVIYTPSPEEQKAFPILFN